MTASDRHRIRVVVSKVGLDGHDRGVKIIAQGLRDAGMEVIYAGLRRTPEQLTEIAIQEDADVVGLSILSGAVVPLAGRVKGALNDAALDDVVLLVGGIISEPVAAELRARGIDAAFGPGTPMAEIVSETRRLVTERRGSSETAEKG